MGKPQDKWAQPGSRLGPAGVLAALAVSLAAGDALAALTDARGRAASRPAARVRFPAAPQGARITREGWFAPPRPARPAPELPEKITNAFIIPIREPISAKTYESFQRRALWARDKDAQLIVLDVDTWGGEVHAALDIARLLKLELQDIYTVCFVRTRAISAGAVIALACNEIVVTTVGKLGDCAPIVAGLKLDPVEREKVESLLRMELVESAEMTGYPPALAECLVTAAREAWLVRHLATRQLRYVLNKDFRRRVRAVPGATTQPANPQAQWEVLRVVVSANELLTMHPRLALEYGFASRQVEIPPKGDPWANLMKELKVVSEPVVLEDAWPDELVRLAQRPVRRGWLAAIRAQVPGASRAPATRPAPATRRATSAPVSFPAAPPGAKIVTTEGEEGWFAPTKRGKPAPPLPEQITKAFIIPIREQIMGKTFDAMKRKVIHAKAKGAELIVFDMDTWGGMVHPALDIARLLKVELHEVYTVCFVRTRAVSAGALIAVACDEIVVTGHGKFGDCMPIVMMGGKLEPAEREKMETVLRNEFAESAEENGYPVAIAECMVTRQREAWLVRHLETGELRYVLRKDFYRKVREAPPETQEIKYTIEGKDEKSEVRGTLRMPAAAPPPRVNPDAKWELLRVVVPAGELPTFHPRQVLEYGFARRQVPSSSGDRPWAELLKEFNVVAEPTVLEDTWSERLVGFLTSPYVMAFLVAVGMLALYVELHTPGIGLPGAVAVMCFAVLFGSRFLIGMAAWWEIALFLVGLILLGLEIFVTPGFGVLGISGILCCVVALLAMTVPNAPNKLPIPDTALSWSLFSTGVAALIVGAIGAVIGAIVVARYLPKVPVAGRLVLAPSTVRPSPTTDRAPITVVQVGDVGTVHSVCRPVGQVRFGEALVDAIADGDMIPTGTKVRVVKKEGNRIVVTRRS